MKIIDKENLEKELLDGAIVYMEGSNFQERRLYRLNKESNELEYSDDAKTWNISAINIEDLKENRWIVDEK